MNRCIAINKNKKWCRNKTNNLFCCISHKPLNFTSIYEEECFMCCDKIIKSNDSTCICKDTNHWLNDCKLNTEKDYWKKLLDKVFTSISKDLKDNGICERCGRFGHDMNNCYANKHIDGSNINDDIDFD
jgi:hypothetical protein